MNYNELINRCKAEGFIDDNGKHIDISSPEDIRRRDNLKRFMELNNLKWDEMFAFFDLALKDEVVGDFIRGAIETQKNIRKT